MSAAPGMRAAWVMPLLVGVAALVPLLTFCWSRWRLILGLVFGVALLVAVVWVVCAVRQRQRQSKRCDAKEENDEEENEETRDGEDGGLADLLGDFKMRG